MSFFLGGVVGESDEPSDHPYQYDPSDLTTHGVIVGMTGSGKTGLGVIYLEEALRSGIPTLVLDPKGDMTNLLLTFPDLAPSDFEPWVDAHAAEREGKNRAEAAEDAAGLWTKGLDSWGLTGGDIGAMRSNTGMTIYTPGSAAGTAINIIGNLSAPEGGFDEHAEILRDEIQSFASGLLGLVDIDADPLSSREHILISNLVERAWQAGSSMDLGDLIGQVANPPMRKLGVFEVEQFFPEKDRLALAMKLNGLLASPSFAAWRTGTPLDIDSLLWQDGVPQASVIYLAHLSDAERQFVVTMILSKVVTWMRTQPGSGDLRALIYMDEVYGFVPPVANPPAKRPILTILKQARAFGIGMLLSTQNPVDLDYKAMSNAGTWCIGRLQTERDKARIIEALTTASGEIDTAAMDATISGLPKRAFVMHSTRESKPTVFSTRWAMSYLRGPMTRDEVGRFKNDIDEPTGASNPPQPSETPSTGFGSTAAAPEIAVGYKGAAIHPSAPWRTLVGDTDNGTEYHAGLAATVELRFDEARVGIDHAETWEAVLPHLELTSIDDLIEVDYDSRDFAEPAEGIAFAEVQAPISQQTFFTAAEKAITDYLDKAMTKSFFRNRPLKLVSRPGESEDAFRERVAATATDKADEAKAKIATKFAPRLRKVQRDYEAAVRDADLASQAIEDSRRDALIGFGMDLLTGRKPRSSRSSSKTAENQRRRAESKIDTKRSEYEDLNIEMEELCDRAEADWADKARDVERLDVGLERDDISVQEIRVVWIRKS